MIKIGQAGDIKIGQAGDISWGKPWDDGGRDEIAQIFVSHGKEINSLQFLYVENGTLVLSEKHGGASGPKFNVVELNYPSELITGISGYLGSRIDNNWDQEVVITSIIFTTNNATYGPFGCPAECDIAFAYQIGGRNKFCGFHGTAGSYLNSIGVYMEPLMTLSNPNPSPKSQQPQPISTASNLRMDKEIADLLSEQDPDALEGSKKTKAQSGTDVSTIHQNNFTIAAVKILTEYIEASSHAAVKVLTEYIEESSQKQMNLLQQLLNKEGNNE